MQNFVPNKTIICDDSDPPWINKETKQLIEQKNQFYIRFIRNNKTLLYIKEFKVLQDEPGFLIEKLKNNYFSKLSEKISNKTASSKTYWSVLKTFFMIMNSLLILEKNLNFLIHTLQSNVYYQRIIVSYQKKCCFLLKGI